VVATLWPVDDHATARFVAAFYRALTAGRSPAGALVDARRHCRADARTAAPRHWAGFVLIGDGSAPLPVRARRAAWPFAAPLLLAAAGLFGLARRRSRPRRRPSSADGPHRL
jgi:hypothetical protein